MISVHWVLETTLRLLSFSVLVQSLEMVRLRSSWSGEGPWSWIQVRKSFESFGRPASFLLDGVLSDRGFLAMTVLEILSAMGCLIYPSLLWTPILLFTALFTAMRWNGTFNGGSDYMTVVVLLSLSFAAIFGSQLGSVPALAYIGLQVVASYFIAGLVKIKEPEWRNGRALQVFLESARDGGPNWLYRISSSRPLCACGAWIVIALELLSPFLLLASRSARGIGIALLLGFGFHLANAVIFGLNRFVWAWIAGYPGVVVLAGVLWHRSSIS